MNKILALLILVASASTTAKPTTILLSFDGFRWDYIEKHQAKNLATLAQQGVRVTKLKPQYPTKTFPNHLSLITGLKPIDHGLVGNYFCDSDRNQCYKMGKGGKDSSWISGIPLWNLAKMHGHKSAVYFWPESDARINGMTPDYFFHYSKLAPEQGRFSQIFDWLSLPKSQRPLFIAAYFSSVDSIGHDFGPDHIKTKQAVQKLDNMLGSFIKQLADNGLEVNLVVVSDHGMTEVHRDKMISVASLNIPKGWTIKNSGTQLSLYRLGNDTLKTESFSADLGNQAQGRYKVLSQSDKNTLFGGNSAKVGDIVLQAKPHTIFIDDNTEEKYFGAHGYGHHPDMDAVFVGYGPSFRQGLVIDEASNLDVYPVLASIMGLPLLNQVSSDGGRLLDAIKK
ncbi:ectonucleotide pyrophosphatase/phosphodiesterase (plasmid) [Pseudoalteromonas sp. T1lg65]|uniref:alkaline phosphatase family protein n=1 Tax=Pseudoalteromonas sp. T1lg65 TaxID=2077101 RepID=UPI003F79E86F